MMIGAATIAALAAFITGVSAMATLYYDKPPSAPPPEDPSPRAEGSPRIRARREEHRGSSRIRR